MHNGYFFPQDVKITTNDGIKTAQVDFELPVLWTEQAIKVAQTCFLSGWEMARRAYEEQNIDDWLKTTYPSYYEEKTLAKELHKAGFSVSGFRVFMEAQKT